MARIVLTLPIVAGKAEAWRRFCQELSGSRLHLYIASRRRLGVTYERLTLSETEAGPAAVNTLEVSDVDRALGQIIRSELPFDVWYREQLEALHGVTLTGYERFLRPAPPTQAQELLFEWTLTPDPAA